MEFFGCSNTAKYVYFQVLHPTVESRFYFAGKCNEKHSCFLCRAVRGWYLYTAHWARVPARRKTVLSHCHLIINLAQHRIKLQLPSLPGGIKSLRVPVLETGWDTNLPAWAEPSIAYLAVRYSTKGQPLSYLCFSVIEADDVKWQECVHRRQLSRQEPQGKDQGGCCSPGPAPLQTLTNTADEISVGKPSGADPWALNARAYL